MLIFSPHYHVFWLVAVSLIGLCLGSFATALIHRLPRDIPMGKASRSACPKCGHGLKFYDLLPLLSYLSTRGKCRYCRAPISKTYPLVELATMALALGLFLIYGYQYFTPALVLLAPVLIAIFVIDLRHMIIPDGLNLSIAAGALIAAALAFVIFPMREFEILAGRMLAGGAVYFLFALGLALAFSRLLKKDALGGGDIKFFGAAGLWLGLDPLPYFMMLSGALGVAFALANQNIARVIADRVGGRAAVRQDKEPGAFPFGPALIAAFVILLALKKTVFLTIS